MVVWKVHKWTLVHLLPYCWLQTFSTFSADQSLDLCNEPVWNLVLNRASFIVCRVSYSYILWGQSFDIGIFIQLKQPLLWGNSISCQILLSCWYVTHFLLLNSTCLAHKSCQILITSLTLLTFWPEIRFDIIISISSISILSKSSLKLYPGIFSYRPIPNIFLVSPVKTKKTCKVF